MATIRLAMVIPVLLTVVTVGVLPAPGRSTETKVNSNVRPVPLSIEDVLKQPEIGRDIRISPDGSHVAMLRQVNAKTDIHWKKIGEEKWECLKCAKASGIQAYQWMDDDRIVFWEDRDGDKLLETLSLKVSTLTEKDITPWKGVNYRPLLTSFAGEGSVFLGKRNNETKSWDLHRFNTRTGKTHLVRSEHNLRSRLWTNSKGAVLMTESRTESKRTIYWRRDEADEFREAGSYPARIYDARGTVIPFFLEGDGKTLVASSNIGRDRLALVRLDASTGKERDLLLEHEAFDSIHHPLQIGEKTLAASAGVPWRYHPINKDAEPICKALDDRFPACGINFVSSSKNSLRQVFSVDSCMGHQSFYCLDLATRRIDLIFDANPWLNASQMCPPRSVAYRNRKGHKLHGVLILPRTKEKKAPMVVLPLQEPWFEAGAPALQTQFWATRGYAVLQFHHRGCSGFGRAFQEAGLGRFGESALEDLIDGVKGALAEEGDRLDSSKVGVCGFYFGGYLALAGTTFHPDVFACGISFNGSPDLAGMADTLGDYYLNFGIKYGREEIERMTGDAKQYAKWSPLAHADKATRAMLISHVKPPYPYAFAKECNQFGLIRLMRTRSRPCLIPLDFLRHNSGVR